MSDPSPPSDSGAEPGKREAPALRASDAEREHTAEALRTAATEGRLDVDELEDRLHSAYTVRTRNELELLLADVTVDSVAHGRGITIPHGGRAPVVREGPGGSRWVVSIMGGNDRIGRWRIAGQCNVINVMGGSDVDLSDAEFSDPVTHLNVFSVMGGSDIHVPEGADVHVSKVALMGGNDVHLGDDVPPVGAPQIRIRLVSVMGGSSVRRGPRRTRAERRRERELRKAERRGELGP